MSNMFIMQGAVTIPSTCSLQCQTAVKPVPLFSSVQFTSIFFCWSVIQAKCWGSGSADYWGFLLCRGELLNKSSLGLNLKMECRPTHAYLLIVFSSSVVKLNHICQIIWELQNYAYIICYAYWIFLYFMKLITQNNMQHNSTMPNHLKIMISPSVRENNNEPVKYIQFLITVV